MSEATKMHKNGIDGQNIPYDLRGLASIRGSRATVVMALHHANSRCTLDVYSQARMDTKREAQQRVVKMILTEETSEMLLRRRGPDERLDNTL